MIEPFLDILVRKAGTLSASNGLKVRALDSIWCTKLLDDADAIEQFEALIAEGCPLHCLGM